MNTEDVKINQKTVSRLDYTKHIMSRFIEDLPCGTKVSIGMFAGVSVSATYTYWYVKTLATSTQPLANWIGEQRGQAIQELENLW